MVGLTVVKCGGRPVQHERGNAMAGLPETDLAQSWRDSRP